MKKEDEPMAFGYVNPRHPFNQFRNEMDRLLTNFLGQTTEDFLPGVLRNQPAVNVWEQDEALKVEMEVPGVKKDQIDIAVAGGELTIKIDRPEASEENVVYHRRERPEGSLSRVLRLPIEVNADKVEADLHDGVLTITLPKAESAKPRKINVTGE
jgi:HSP20 family protein